MNGFRAGPGFERHVRTVTTWSFQDSNMPLEVYRLNIGIKYESVTSTTSFYYLVDNDNGSNQWKVSEAIVEQYCSVSPWLFLLRFLLSVDCFVQTITCRIIRPTTGPQHRVRLKSTSAPGLWDGKPLVNFVLANVRWHFTGDLTGKHGVRLGPVGMGAIDNDGWTNPYHVVVSAWLTEQLAVQPLSVGLDALPCINHQTSGGTVIESATLLFPPGRQINRRWVQ